MRPITLAMTGASGAVYGVRLLEAFLCAEEHVNLIVSPAARQVLRAELGLQLDDPFDVRQLLQINDPIARHANGLNSCRELSELAESFVTTFDYKDYAASIASGSCQTRAMVICPCSLDTLAGISAGLASNLVLRAAAVHLKERRQLVLVPRETPLSSIVLQNMLRISEAGATILPAMPGFYHRPQSVGDLVDFVVARVCDHLEVSHQLSRRWEGPIDES